MDNELIYKIAITKIQHVGAVTAKNLISYCGGAKAVFEASKKELLKIPNIGDAIAESIIQQKVLAAAEEELIFIENNNIQTFFYTDKNYPSRLKQYHDAPVLLFYKGNADLNHYRTVGIVGTRKPSTYGKTVCEDLVEGLKKYNVSIISGLAYGIDVTAHKKSVLMGIENIGVLGHGLARIYPADHKSVAEKMIQCGGILTEFHSGVEPDRENFPMRNRIIAALSDALIVVETPNSGGSMISAQLANEYNKDVFAVPGRLNDLNSQGCNHLIKTHKAALIESADDIAYIMRWDAIDAQKTIQRQLFVELNEQEQALIDYLRQQGDASIDQLSYQMKCTSSELAMLLLDMEFKGLIQSLPGKRYQVV